MAKTMEQYMSKTRADYGSGIARPKIDDKDHFKLKGQFLKELRDNTFSDSDNKDANEHIEKVLEIVDLFHVPNITQDQIMLRVFHMSLTRATSCWLRNKPSGSSAIPNNTAADTKVAIQEMAEYSQKCHNGTSKTRSTETSDGLAAIQVQLNNLGREIKKMSNVLQERGFGSLPSSTETTLRDHVILTEEMRQTLADRLRMVYTGDEGQELISDTELRLDETDTLCFQLGGARQDGFEAYWLGSTRAIPDNRDLRDYWIEVSSDRDFLGTAPSYVYIRDSVRRLCHKMISYSIFGRGQTPEKVTSIDPIYLRSMDQAIANVPYMLAQYLFRHAEGREIGARMLGGHFIGRLAAHFGMVGDTLAWVAPGPERQQVVTAGAPKVVEDAPVVDEGAPVVPAPVHAPQPPPTASPTRSLP
ncbi:hypothetical protein Tco_1144215 [Tanacetum coccineum]